jgi:hypothetical protein
MSNTAFVFGPKLVSAGRMPQRLKASGNGAGQADVLHCAAANAGDVVARDDDVPAGFKALGGDRLLQGSEEPRVQRLQVTGAVARQSVQDDAVVPAELRCFPAVPAAVRVHNQQNGVVLAGLHIGCKGPHPVIESALVD